MFGEPRLTDRYCWRSLRRRQHWLGKAIKKPSEPARSYEPHDVAYDVALELQATEVEDLLAEHPEWKGLLQVVEQTRGNLSPDEVLLRPETVIALPDDVEVHANDLFDGVSLLELAQRQLAITLEKWLLQWLEHNPE